MTEKDFREKRLEDYDDVFVDIINGLIFHGDKKVDESDLEIGMLRSGYKLEEKFEEQDRDVKKYRKSGHVRIAVFGIENQTGVDPDFIFRNIGYDGAEYRDQVRRRSEIRRKNAAAVKNTAVSGKEAVLESLPDFYPVVTPSFVHTAWVCLQKTLKSTNMRSRIMVRR